MRALRLTIKYEGSDLPDFYEMSIWQDRRKLVWKELTREEQLCICNSLSAYWTRLVNDLNRIDK